VANAVYPQPKLPVTATIAGIDATVLYGGAAPTLVAGVLQVMLRSSERAIGRAGDHHQSRR